MAEGATETLLRSFARTLESRDLEKALSFFSPDAVYLNPSGRFTGTTEIRRYVKVAPHSLQVACQRAVGHVRQCGVPPSLHLRAS